MDTMDILPDRIRLSMKTVPLLAVAVLAGPTPARALDGVQWGKPAQGMVAVSVNAGTGIPLTTGSQLPALPASNSGEVKGAPDTHAGWTGSADVSYSWTGMDTGSEIVFEGHFTIDITEAGTATVQFNLPFTTTAPVSYAASGTVSGSMTDANISSTTALNLTPDTGSDQTIYMEFDNAGITSHWADSKDIQFAINDKNDDLETAATGDTTGTLDTAAKYAFTTGLFLYKNPDSNAPTGTLTGEFTFRLGSGTATASGVGPFGDSLEPQGGERYSPWFHWVNDASYPWVWSSDHGWLYFSDDDPASLWVYSPDYGWFWISNDSYQYGNPQMRYFFSLDLDTWVYFYQGKTDRWVYAFPSDKTTGGYIDFGPV